MSVIYFLVPLAGLFVTAAVVAFFVAARNGQFDDLDTPPLRVLFDDEQPHLPSREGPASAGERGLSNQPTETP